MTVVQEVRAVLRTSGGRDIAELPVVVPKSLILLALDSDGLLVLCYRTLGWGVRGDTTV